MAAGGERGVARVLSLLREELEAALALCGCADLRQVREVRGLAVRASPAGPGTTYARAAL